MANRVNVEKEMKMYVENNVPKIAQRFFQKKGKRSMFEYFNYLSMDLLGEDRRKFVRNLDLFLEDRGEHPEKWSVAHLYAEGLISKAYYEASVKRLTKSLCWLNTLAKKNGFGFINFKVDTQDTEDCLGLLTSVLWYFPEYHERETELMNAMAAAM